VAREKKREIRKKKMRARNPGGVKREKLSHFWLNVIFAIPTKGPFTQAIFVAQLNATFVAPKLQIQNCACKPPAILVRF
jgi:hypothetical protein